MSKPHFIAYSIIEREGKKDYWHAIGAAWPNKKGDGFNLKLDSLPLDGEIALLPPKADDTKA